MHDIGGGAAICPVTGNGLPSDPVDIAGRLHPTSPNEPPPSQHGNEPSKTCRSRSVSEMGVIARDLVIGTACVIQADACSRNSTTSGSSRKSLNVSGLTGRLLPLTCRPQWRLSWAGLLERSG